MRRAYKFRAYPTRPQQGRAVRLLADHCDLYNAAPIERREAWRMRRVNIGYGTQSAQLKEIRRADPDGQGRHSFTAQQQTLRRLDAVFAGFFDRVRAAEQVRHGRNPGYPRIKPYQRFGQVLFVAGDGARWQSSGGGKWAYATFQAVGTVKVHKHRQIPGVVKTLQLVCEYRRWYVIVTVAKAGLNKAILDAGWAQFVNILSDKAAEAGRRVVLVNPAGTSIVCHQCGRQCDRPRQDIVICPVHGETDADVNGACNIIARAGLGSGQAAAAA